jgi:sec-independent protein translocase protein TatA
MTSLFAFFEGALSPSHILIVLSVGILLFGKKLPEIGRSLGKGLTEFKKGLHGIEDEVGGFSGKTAEVAGDLPRPPQRVPAAAPTFDKVEA